MRGFLKASGKLSSKLQPVYRKMVVRDLRRSFSNMCVDFDIARLIIIITMSESLTEVRNLIAEMYDLAGIVAESAQDFYDDCELLRPHHAMFQYAQFKQLSKGMIGQDSG